MNSRSRLAVCASVGFALFLLGGCGGDSGMAEVAGTVTVNGETPEVGSSINFIPADGKSPSAGALIENGKYAAKVPLGPSKVEIRVPRPVNRKKILPQEGPGRGPEGGTIIEESLPPEYNSRTKLSMEVKPGRNEKDWKLDTKTK